MKGSSRIRLFLMLALASAALLALTACAKAKAAAIDYPVRVMLASADNLTVNGDSVVTVDAGGSADFDVTVPDGMKVILSDGAVYENGRITLSDVWYPTTIKATVRDYMTYKYRARATSGGSVTKGEKDWTNVTEDDTVTVTAKASRRKMFAGWSLGKSLEDGGTIISTDSKYTFAIEKNMDLIANFLDEGARIVRYDMNGGETYDGGASFVDTVVDDYHFYANTLPNYGMFVRDGYVLLGYNTEPDGSGDYYACGWNIISDETVVDLYCVWAEETPSDAFEFKRVGNEYAVTSYSGSYDTIVVPATYRHTNVTSIESKAFSDADADTIILPSTITTVERGAFTSCGLSTLYMPDTITTISDRSFSKCNNFSTLNVYAARTPTYQTADHGTYSIKYERLVYATEHDMRKLVFTSGSNGTYGVLSAQLEEELGGAFYIIDYALHYQTCGMFFIDLISDFLEEDDVFVFMPEPNEFQLGSNAWNAIMWQFFEAAYESVTHVDIRDYKGVFDTFAEFNNTRNWMWPTSYTDYWNGIDRYGDNSWFRSGERANFIGSQGTYSLGTGHIDVDNINSVFDKCAATGAKTYFSFPSLNKNALVKDGKNESHRKAYENYIRDNLHITVISDIEDYIFEARYMSGTNYHLSTEGSKIRTERLGDDIIRQLNKDYGNGKWMSLK